MKPEPATKKEPLLLPPPSSPQFKRALSGLVTSSGYNKTLLDSITSQIIILDRHLNITFVNNAAEKLLRVSNEHITGKNLGTVNFQGIGWQLKENLGQVIQEGKTFNVKAIQYLTPVEEVRFIDFIYRPLKDGQGKIIGIMAMGNDVTRRIQEEKKLLAHQQTLEKQLMERTKEQELLQNSLNELEQQLGRSQEEVALLRDEVIQRYSFHHIIGKNKKMQEIFQLIPRVADSDTSVLITGETGTGKELIARAVHYTGCRRRKNFVAINCAALTETLLESELFGHVKGAFTGAIRDKKGKFELAHGGTLFLDEVGEMPPLTQSKLLRVLQEKEIVKVGGETTVKVDVRIIAATNQNLEQLISQGKLRQDIYYRLTVISIQLPPLRERRDDLPLLAAHLLKKYARKLKKRIKGISPNAWRKIMTYHWPGNIRELENVIERELLMAQGETIEDVDLPLVTPVPSALYPDYASPPAFSPSGMEDYLTGCEKEYLSFMLQQCRGNIKRVSQLSGLNRRTIYNKMKKYGISKKDYKNETPTTTNEKEISYFLK